MEMTAVTDPAEAGAIHYLPVDQIVAGDNDRTDFDSPAAQEALRELADSIDRLGLAQPITVVPAEDGGWRIVAGERRYRAVRLLGRPMIEAIVRDLTPAGEADVMLAENLARRDLNVIEEAQAYRKRLDAGDITEAELAAAVGKKAGYLRRRLSLLNLIPEIQHALTLATAAPGTGGMFLSNAEDLVNLDPDRQHKAWQVYCTSPNLTVEGWRLMLAEMRTAQNEEAQQGFGFQVEDLRAVANRARRRPPVKDLVRLLEQIAEHVDLPTDLADQAAATLTDWSAYYATTGGKGNAR